MSEPVACVYPVSLPSQVSNKYSPGWSLWKLWVLFKFIFNAPLTQNSPSPWRPATKGYAARFIYLFVSLWYALAYALAYTACVPRWRFFYRPCLADCFGVRPTCAARMRKRLSVGERLLRKLDTLQRHTMASTSDYDMLYYRTKIRSCVYISSHWPDMATISCSLGQIQEFAL